MKIRLVCPKQQQVIPVLATLLHAGGGSESVVVILVAISKRK